MCDSFTELPRPTCSLSSSTTLAMIGGCFISSAMAHSMVVLLVSDPGPNVS